MDVSFFVLPAVDCVLCCNVSICEQKHDDAAFGSTFQRNEYIISGGIRFAITEDLVFSTTKTALDTEELELSEIHGRQVSCIESVEPRCVRGVSTLMYWRKRLEIQ